MATGAMKALASLTLGSTQATVTFSSITQTYRDLRLIINGQATGSSNMLVSYNGDTLSNNYFWGWILGNGSTASATNSNDRVFGNSQNAQGAQVYDILEYSSTDRQKTSLGKTSFAGIEVILVSQRWTSASAITSIALTANGTTWAAGTTFTLYGVSA